MKSVEVLRTKYHPYYGKVIEIKSQGYDEYEEVYNYWVTFEDGTQMSLSDWRYEEVPVNY